MENMLFQQDCATAHTTRATTDMLTQPFSDRLIPGFGDLQWQEDRPIFRNKPDIGGPKGEYLRDFFAKSFVNSCGKCKTGWNLH